MESDFDTRKKINNIVTEKAYYFIIAIVSIVSTIFLPMIGSSAGFGFNLPDTVEGWVVEIFIKLLVSGLNVLIFYCFVTQAKVNVRNDANFIKANELMSKLSKKRELKPRSPKKFLGGQWATKGVTIFIGSVASIFVLSDVLLNFNIVQFLTYIFTILMGVIFGYITMRKHESYWTGEYLLYAEEQQKEIEDNVQN